MGNPFFNKDDWIVDTPVTYPSLHTFFNENDFLRQFGCNFRFLTSVSVLRYSTNSAPGYESPSKFVQENNAL